MNVFQWDLTSKVRLISVFTDTDFQYEDNHRDQGAIEAPLHSWGEDDDDYKYHNPDKVVHLADQTTTTGTDIIINGRSLISIQ